MEQQNTSKTTWYIVMAAFVVVLVIGGIIAANANMPAETADHTHEEGTADDHPHDEGTPDDHPHDEDTAADHDDGIEGVVSFEITDATHNPNAEYDTVGLPPAGGIHSPNWQNCGVYDAPIDSANAVHSLEHGAVWIAYQPDLDAEAVETLRTLTRQTDHRLLAPYPELASPIVLTAWGFQLSLDSVDDERLVQFIETYENAQTAPEPGVTCANSAGRPIN